MIARGPDPTLIVKPAGALLRLVSRLAELARKVERT